MQQPARFGHVRRWVRLLGWLWLGWLVPANLLLLSGLAEGLANRRPERFSLAVERAWSVVPLLVHVRGLELEGNTPRRHWQVSAERATCVFAVPTLVLRRVDLPWCRALDLTLDFQPARVALEPSTRPRWRTIVWQATVDELRAVRVDDLELTTPGGTVHGGFELLARGPFSSRSIRLRAPSSTLTSGAIPVATELSLDAEARVRPFVPAEHPSIDALAFISGHLDASTKQGSLAFLGRHLGRRPWLSFDGAQGATLEANLRIESGALSPGSRLVASSEAVELGLLRWTLRGGVELEITVDPQGKELVVAQLDHITLHRPTRADPIAHGASARLELALDDAVLYRVEPSGSATFDLPSAKVPDLRVFGDLLPQRAGLDIVQGRAQLEASLAIHSTRPDAVAGPAARASFGLTAVDVEIEARGRQVVADLVLQLELEAQGEAVRLGRFDASGSSLVVSRGAAARGAPVRDDRRFSARLDFERASLELRGSPRFGASCRITASDLRPVLGLALEGERSIDRVERWLELSEVEGTMGLQLVPGELELRQVELSSGPAHLSAELCFRHDRHLLLHGAWNRFDIGRELAGTDHSRWKLVGVDSWYRERAASWECLGPTS